MRSVERNVGIVTSQPHQDGTCDIGRGGCGALLLSASRSDISGNLLPGEGNGNEVGCPNAEGGSFEAFAIRARAFETKFVRGTFAEYGVDEAIWESVVRCPFARVALPVCTIGEEEHGIGRNFISGRSDGGGIDVSCGQRGQATTSFAGLRRAISKCRLEDLEFGIGSGTGGVVLYDIRDE